MKAVTLVLPVLLLAVPAQARDLKPTIDAANQEFSAAFDKGEAAKLAQFYTEDATVLPAGSPMVQGRSDVQKFWQGAIDAGLKNLTLHTVSVETYGSGVAREIGRFTLEAPNQQKQMTRVEGKYVVIWKHVGKSWKLATDIWNMNK